MLQEHLCRASHWQRRLFNYRNHPCQTTSHCRSRCLRGRGETAYWDCQCEAGIGHASGWRAGVLASRSRARWFTNVSMTQDELAKLP